MKISKNIAIIIIYLFIAHVSPLYAQNNADKSKLTLSIQNKFNYPVLKGDLWLTEKDSKTRLESMSNKDGDFVFEVISGKTYIVNFNKYQYPHEISIPTGGSWDIKKTIVYDPYNTTSGTDNDDNVIYKDTVKLNGICNPLGNEALVNIKIVNKKKAPMPNIAVKMRSKAIGKIYATKTGADGIAVFCLPLNTDFKLVVVNYSNYSIIHTPKKADEIIDGEYEYQAADIKETKTKDTVKQELTADVASTLDRVLFSIKLKDFNENDLVDEPISINVKNERLIYYTSTNSKGEATFMLPVGKSYVVHFKYERNVDLLNYNKIPGYKSFQLEYHYLGSKVIEEREREKIRLEKEAIERAKLEDKERKERAFTSKFYSSKAESIQPPMMIYEKKAFGEKYNFSSRGDMPAPTYFNGKIVASAGFYSNLLHCIDVATHKIVWTIKLSEGGPTSITYYNGWILVNTESCTLYIINAITGKLVWSKYLANYIRSTPSVYNNAVYTCFPSHLDRKDFEITAFSLKDGSVLWQNWVDAEIVMAPIIDTSGLYTITTAGTLYHFNQKNGKLIKMLNGSFYEPPTIIGNKIYITQTENIEKNNGKSQMLNMLVLNKQDLKVQKNLEVFNVDLAKGYNSIFDEMNKQTHQMIHTGNENYCVTTNKLICYNAQTDIVEWSSILKDIDLKNYVSSPIVIGENIYVGISSGKILAYNKKNGQLVKEYNTNEPLLPLLIFGGKALYCGTPEGELLKINTVEKNNGEWPMLNNNASHNPIAK